mgnify:FL=1|tara:strand:+ start:13 stop:867 length:855 start_codon:yes stop_codon:yes gene_type:complete
MITPFLQYVSEARIVRRQDDLSRYTYQEIEERVYLTFLALTLLKNFNSSKSFTKQYANNTLTYGGFERVRTTANDLHNMLAVLDGNTDILDKLSNKTQAKALRQRHPLPTLAVKRFLRTFSDEYKFLSQLERSLGIKNSDYKNLKIAITDFKNLDSRRKKVTVTRLLQALRAKLGGTDILRQIEALSGQQDFELDNVVDAERTPGAVPMSADELNAYRILVGPTNLRRAKIAVDLAKQGKGLPGPVAASYYPIMKIIDNIAKGGFTFVRLLQTIADRAEKNIKR